jgi:hypothetical protein
MLPQIDLFPLSIRHPSKYTDLRKFVGSFANADPAAFISVKLFTVVIYAVE